MAPLSRTFRRVALPAVTALLLLTGACAGDESSSPTTTGGTTPGTTPGAPGTVVSRTELSGAGIPAGAQAWSIEYASTDPAGAPITVTGLVVAPTGDAPAGGRPMVSWAHPTTGIAESCAPSLLPSNGGLGLIAGLADFVAAGYVVTATDYPGLGTPGPHPYLIGESEGRAVLDAARAARALPTGANEELLVWGHSQGGHASLWAAQIAPDYAPDLTLKGAAAAAPAGKLAEIMRQDLETLDGVILGAYAVQTWSEIYGPTTPGLEPSKVLTAEGLTALPELTPLCDLTQSSQMETIAQPLIGSFWAIDPADDPAWAPLLDKNTPGQVKLGVPVFIAQGTADVVVPPDTTATLVQGMCANDDRVELKTYPEVTHTLIGVTSAGDVAAWMASVLDGSAGPGTCP